MDAEKVAEKTAGKKLSKKQRMYRWLIGIAAALAVFFVAALLFLDWTAAAAIRNAVPYFTGTPVELQNVRIGIFSGRVELHGFKICNPEGFSRPYAMELDHFVFDADLGTVFSSKPEVEVVSIDGMLIDYEISRKGTNLGMIQDHLKSVLPAGNGEAKTSGEPAGGKKFVIRRLEVSGVSLAAGPVKVPLPPIGADNLGDGKSLGELFSDFWEILMQSVQKALSSQLIQNVGDAAGDLGTSAENAVQNAADSIKKFFK